MRIALDAMGGDTAPLEQVRGVVQAAKAFADAEIILVGDEALIREALGKEHADAGRLRLRIHHAPDRIEMGASPVQALRGRPNNSISQTVRLVADGEADTAICAGNTGAFVAAASLALRPLKGVRRPGIAVTMPAADGGHTTVIDMGANVHCKSIHLYQYAVMASIYHRSVIGIDNPRVGLLNVGSEEGKGTALAKEVHALLNASSLNFIGNVEGGDIFNGHCDVVVCDGFTGNVLLKASEGIAETILRALLKAREGSLSRRLGLRLLKPLLMEMIEWMDFAEYGGAPLLGVEGECIICHGRSDARAFRNAVRAALSYARKDVNGTIEKVLQAEQSAVADLTASDGERER